MKKTTNFVYKNKVYALPTNSALIATKIAKSIKGRT